MSKYNFLYSNINYDDSSCIDLTEINDAASRLYNKLKNIDLNAINLSEYNKNYFGRKLDNLSAELQLAGYLIYLALRNSQKSMTDISLIDYGGGSGLISLLAKEIGIGLVIYNDIYDISCNDARSIADFIGNRADQYIHGEIDEVLNYLQFNPTKFYTIVSYDVIEHIYDIQLFLTKITSNARYFNSAVLASGANKKNPIKNNKLMHEQRIIENNSREKHNYDKERDCYRAYFQVRLEIITEYLIEKNIKLEEKIIKKLSKRTRGKIKPEIIKTVELYLNIKKIPVYIKHPTNTCDPYTGNWAEHLIDHKWLLSLLAATDYESRILSGYYGYKKNKFKNRIVSILNTLIFYFKNVGIKIAPYYILYLNKQ